MPPTRAIWPRHSLMLYGCVIMTGLMLALMVPDVRPVLAHCLPMLVLVPCAAAAGHVPHYAVLLDELGSPWWMAWRSRLVGLAMALLVFASWQKMFDRSLVISDDLSFLGVLTPLVMVAMLGVLALALIAGNTDQREENENMALDFVSQLRR